MTENSFLLEDHEVMAREPDLQRLRLAYDLLQTDRSSAIAELEKLVSAGSVMGALYLAESFAKGPHADDDATEKWLKSAYEHNSARGLICLAMHYAKKEEYNDAEKIYLEGVSQNDAQSTYYLAKMYVRTNRFTLISPEIRNLLERAAALGHPAAMRDLWQLHVKGTYGILSIPKGFLLLLCFLSKNFALAFGQRPDAFGPSDRRLW